MTREEMIAAIKVLVGSFLDWNVIDDDHLREMLHHLQNADPEDRFELTDRPVVIARAPAL